MLGNNDENLLSLRFNNEFKFKGNLVGFVENDIHLTEM